MVTHIFATPVALAESEIHKPIEFFEGVATMPTQTQSEAIKETNLRAWMVKLAERESSGNCSVVIVDTNGRLSTGKYMYQNATWLSMGKKYGLPTTLENIKDCELQDEVTYQVLKNETRGHMNWRCSVYGTNLEEQYGLDPICKRILASIGVTDKAGIGLPPVL